jgi:hypothetical protein
MTNTSKTREVGQTAPSALSEAPTTKDALLVRIARAGGGVVFESSHDIIMRADESVPGALDSSDDSDPEEEEDNSDPEGLKVSRISSSTVPFVVLEFAPKNGRFNSDDPLFQGVCLYSGSMTGSQRKAYASTQKESTASKKVPSSTSSWFFPSIFQYLLNMRRQQVRH